MIEPVEEVVEPRRRKIRPKGERSRQAILDATLVVIAKRGLHSVTHRAIAAQANVPLSLTTYFFKNLNDLIGQAFDYFAERAQSDNSRMLLEIADYVGGILPDTLSRMENRIAIRDELANRLTDFIVFMAVEHSIGVAVEVNFLYLYRLEPELRQKVVAYRDAMTASIAALIRPLAPDPESADVDAALILGLVHRLEFECMNHPEKLPRDQVYAEVSRQVGYILALR
ncbi:TetR/AcrR family transcriptional regulator [Chitinimonas lacunae]|uniref:TetR/AcrR family transcriptional regulator n=1 Tax=Chitinimonas lacunae TaxID=1963018 RepID=A0ABV8MQW5_9NEIS